MSQHKNGGPSSHGTAARYHNPSNYHTALLTHSDACQQLQERGYNIDNLPQSGNGRIPGKGKGPDNIDTAVSWTADGQALHWRDFSNDDGGTLFASNVLNISKLAFAKLSTQTEEKRRKAEANRLVLQNKAARQAQDRYRAGTTGGTHRYLTIKQLCDLYNARIEKSTGALLIPMWVSRVGLVNLQCIWGDGRKRFLKGGRVKGAYSVIGSLRGAKNVLVCEGWATGASLFELFGLPVVVAFNAGNLMPVCQVLRSRFENLAVVVAGDDDRLKPVNTGRQKAIQAAEAIDAVLLFPEFCQCCTCTDWNDRAACNWRCGRD